ncbi:MAG: DUF2795 domain-containing protein [Myxococcaceae bacterium]
MGLHEDPARSVTAHIDAAEFPISREDLVLIAEDNGAPYDIINLFKSLPREDYDSREMVFRDLAEAARRMAMGNTREEDPYRDRRNIGRDLVEEHPGAAGRHP